MPLKRSLLVPLAVAAVLLASGPPGRAAAPVAGDSLCSASTQYVVRYNEQTVNPNTPVDDVIATIDKAISTYDDCASSMGSNGSAEGRHYAQMRSAQFHVARARIQRLLEDYDGARFQYKLAIGLVKDTIDWRNGSRSSSSQSFYWEPASKIRDVAQGELDGLPKPAATSSPAPK